jgi:hypothetical protein
MFPILLGYGGSPNLGERISLRLIVLLALLEFLIVTAALPADCLFYYYSLYGCRGI